MNDDAGGIDYRPQAGALQRPQRFYHGAYYFVNRGGGLAGGNGYTLALQAFSDDIYQKFMLIFPQVRAEPLIGKDAVHAGEAAKLHLHRQYSTQ